MKRLKPLLPTLKEKKRYVAFEIISKTKKDFTAVSKSIWRAALSLVGTTGAARMGLQLFPEHYNNQRGIIRVSHTSVDELNASLAMVRHINDEPVIIRSIGVSGILAKATRYTQQ